tara:strand:- start:523 stop:750 length:228 start_codon:yes stop_codon:yes gene_type:complete
VKKTYNKIVVNEKLERIFQSGYAAFSNVDIRKNKFFHQIANPMKKDTVPHHEWQRGWNTAYFDNLEKLNGFGKRS